MTRLPNVIEAALLGRLAARPAGDPTLSGHNYLPSVVHHGWATVDAVGTPHITAAGWWVAGSYRHHRIWLQAAREHGFRQGPVDAAELRRLIAEYRSTVDAARRLAGDGSTDVAVSVEQEATLIRVRLAVIVHLPPDAEPFRVLRAAHALAELLEERTLAAHGEPATVDQRGILERHGLPVPGDPYLDPWTHRPADVGGALLES